jgi:hypothetical protein
MLGGCGWSHTPSFVRYAYPNISDFPTQLPHMLHCHYTGTTHCHKITVTFHGLDAFAHKKRITDRSSTVVRLFSTVAILDLKLGKLATW